MPRKSFQVRHGSQQTDTLYNSHLVRLFVNQMTKKGKARLAHRLLYTAIDLCGTSQDDGVDILSKAVLNVTPTIEVRPRRRGGSIYQVPMKVSANRGTTFQSVCYHQARHRAASAPGQKDWLKYHQKSSPVTLLVR